MSTVCLLVPYLYEHYIGYIRLQNVFFSWLSLYKLVIFRYILTKVGDKSHIWLFNSYVKLHSKIWHAAEISPKVEGIVFWLAV